MLKHCLLALVLVSVAYALVPSAVAQDSGTNNQQDAPPEHGRGGHFDPERRTEMLTRQLKLNAEQQPKVLDILKSAQSQMQSLRSDSSVPDEDRRAKMMEIHKASDAQIRTLLDTKQQKKWDEMQSERQQWRGHRPEGQTPNSPGSSPQN